MKKFIQYTFLGALMLVFASSTYAQKKFSNGTINLKITKVESENPMASMIQGSTIDVYIKGDMVRADANLMSGMMRYQTFTNTKKNTGTMFTDMMGQKSEVPMDMDDNMIKDTPKFSVTYDKKDTKEIAGYKCHRADVKMETGETFSLYLTDKITVKIPFPQAEELLNKLEGFPLEGNIDQKDIKMTIKAIAISTKAPADNTFKQPDGYEKMTQDEFKKKMRSMGGK